MSFLQTLSNAFTTTGKSPDGGGDAGNKGANFTPNQSNNNMQFQQSANPKGNSASTIQGGASMPNSNGNGGNAGGPKSEPNPMDRFGDPFNNKETPDAAPTFTLDPKILGDVASSQDFFKGIDPELIAKAQSGDTQAMQQMNMQAMQNMYKTVMSHAGTLTDKFVSARDAHNDKGFGKKIKSELTANTMADHPAMKNPVVKKQLNEVAQRFAAQNPDASPAEIKEMTLDYVKTLGSLFADKPAQTSKGNNSGDADFAEWFGDAEEGSGHNQGGSTFFN